MGEGGGLRGEGERGERGRKGRGEIRLSEIIYKNSRAFAKSKYSVFMQGGVRRQDAFGEPLDHGAGEGEVLVGKERKEDRLA